MMAPTVSMLSRLRVSTFQVGGAPEYMKYSRPSAVPITPAVRPLMPVSRRTSRSSMVS